MTIVLIGPPAAGKTRIGKRLAKRLGLPFVDTDAVVVAQHGPIPGIFAEHGEPYFRELERAAVAAAVSDGGVVSLGGGAVTDAATRALLTRHPVVFLTVSPEAVSRRIGGTGRPLLTGDDDPLERWRRIFEERRGWYEEVADLTVDTSRTPMRMLAERIAAWRKEQE